MVAILTETRPTEDRSSRENSRVGPLDGVRGLALVAVLLYHAAPGTVRGGFLGVESFFVLSGYLLTALLLAEHHRTGTVSRRRYASRRVRRIYPAMVTLLVALVVFVPLLDHADAHRLPGDVWSSVFGLTNWHLIADGSSYFTRLGNPSFVRHLWSIAIELQFYVLCPFLVAWLARRTRAVAIRTLLAGMAASSLAMALLYRSPDPSRAYFGTDTRVGALLAGCLLAVVLTRHGENAMAERFRTTWSQVGGPVALGALVLLVAFANETSRLLYPGGFLATQAATGTLIAVSLRPGWVSGFLDRAQLRWLGKRSYGIYLWHWPLVVLTLHWSRLLAGVVTISGALVLGGLSYGLVERPFFDARPRPHSRAVLPLRTRRIRSAVLGLGVLGLVVLFLRLPTTDPIAHSLEVGQRVLAQQVTPAAVSTTPPVTVPSTLPTGVATPPPTTAVPVPPPPPPPAPIPVFAIGDSVMVGAAPQLQAKLGPGGFIDARVGRQFDEAARVTGQLGGEGRLGRVVIVHLGDNGAITSAEVDALMAQLDKVPVVLFVNVRVTRDWQNEVNQTLAAAVARYPKAKLVDWFGYSAPHGEWFERDGTHVKTSGAQGFADLIASSIPPPPPPPPPPPTTTTTAPSPPVTTISGPTSPG